MNLVERYRLRAEELRQVDAQIAGYQGALRELFERRGRLRGQVAELADLIAEVRAAEPPPEPTAE